MTKIATLCLFLKGNKVLLASKQDGFGEGKINAFGGKPKEGESVEQAAIREAYEEVCLRVEPDNLQKVGIIRFHFAGEFKWEMHIFLVEVWQGEPQSTREMVDPVWYNTARLPWGEMWAGDQFWLPSVFSGEKVNWDIHYTTDGKSVERVLRHQVDF